MLASIIIVPNFFHDVILTVERTDFDIRNDSYFSLIWPDRNVLKDLGIESFFSEADANYEENSKTGRPCPDLSGPYYRNYCQSQGEIKSYKASQIMLRFTFNHQTSEFHSAVMADDQGKMYVVYLDSKNWKDYVIYGSLVSIVGVLISVWIFVKQEKYLERIQNHLIGATLATLVGLVLLLSFLSVNIEPVILFPPFTIMFIGPPFVVVYALWYFIFGRKFVNE